MAYPVKIGYGRVAMADHAHAAGSSREAVPAVILGSGSPYRRELLSRLLAEFEVVVPAIDEAAKPFEACVDLAPRLARMKAQAVSRLHPAAIIIASDQVAECDGHPLGKPGSIENAVKQLAACSRKVLTLHTAVCVFGPRAGQIELCHLDQTRLQFRDLSTGAIERYVQRDLPLDCAGSFRFEGLGAALFAEVQTRDPTAIQGLPLLWVTQALEQLGVGVL